MIIEQYPSRIFNTPVHIMKVLSPEFLWKLKTKFSFGWCEKLDQKLLKESFYSGAFKTLDSWVGQLVLYLKSEKPEHSAVACCYYKYVSV